MIWLWSGLTVFTLLYWAAMFGINLRGLPLIPELSVQKGPGDTPEPRLSVIVAAKEEADSIARTMRTTLDQHYGSFELIAVNDRSEDRTGEEMERIAAWAREHRSDVPVQVLHIERLPEGWLGKNNALYQGVQQASGEWFLFTDADVVFQPHAFRSAVAHMRRERADHLSLFPAMLANGVWLRGFVHFFMFSLGLYKWMWKPNLDHQHKDGMGIGAFNLITRAAYEEIGTHAAIALRPDDDLELGMRVKRAGLRQRVAVGREHLAVEWYPHLKAAIKGLEKNLFAGLRYQIWMLAVAVFGQLLVFVWPFLAVWAGGWLSAANGLSILLMFALYLYYVRKTTSYRGGEVALMPFLALLFVYVLLRSSVLTLRQGGIYWRGTFYSLDELKTMMNDQSQGG
jgi:glycosyltransferase involved in cell wall biosynthesis